MKKQLIPLLAAIMLCITSCEDEITFTELGCELQSVEHSLDADTIRVTYKLEGEGDFKVVSWTYITPEGEVTIQLPEVPAEQHFTFTGQAKMRAKASVKVNEGYVKVSYKAITTDSTYVGIDQCEQQIN